MPGPNTPAVKAGWATPMFWVADIERSIRYYELLGFEVIDTDRCEPLGWARIHCEGGAVMFLRAEEPVDPEAQAVMLVMYTADLPALRDQLAAAGLDPAPIGHPPYMPSGELCLRDPDGYGVFVNHWGEAENAAWLERIGRAPAPEGGGSAVES